MSTTRTFKYTLNPNAWIRIPGHHSGGTDEFGWNSTDPLAALAQAEWAQNGTVTGTITTTAA